MQKKLSVTTTTQLLLEVKVKKKKSTELSKYIWELKNSSINYDPNPGSPCLKLLRIMLETSNLTHKYRHIYSLRKCTFQYQDPLNFADVNIFWPK